MFCYLIFNSLSINPELTLVQWNYDWKRLVEQLSKVASDQSELIETQIRKLASNRSWEKQEQIHKISFTIETLSQSSD